MSFHVLRSENDPNYFVITNQENLDRAVHAYRREYPADGLAPVMGEEAFYVLEQVPDMSVVESFIDMMGFYGHSS